MSQINRELVIEDLSSINRSFSDGEVDLNELRSTTFFSKMNIFKDEAVNNQLNKDMHDMHDFVKVQVKRDFDKRKVSLSRINEEDLDANLWESIVCVAKGMRVDMGYEKYLEELKEGVNEFTAQLDALNVFKNTEDWVEDRVRVIDETLGAINTAINEVSKVVGDALSIGTEIRNQVQSVVDTYNGIKDSVKDLMGHFKKKPGFEKPKKNSIGEVSPFDKALLDREVTYSGFVALEPRAVPEIKDNEVWRNKEKYKSTACFIENLTEQRMLMITFPPEEISEGHTALIS